MAPILLILHLSQEDREWVIKPRREVQAGWLSKGAHSQSFRVLFFLTGPYLNANMNQPNPGSFYTKLLGGRGMKISRNTKGFTLIELLIVVAIIGILAAIAIPAYTGYTAKAKIAGVVHNMGAIKNALMAYYTEASAYPDAADYKVIYATFGVEPSTQYATYKVTACTAAAGTTPPAGGAITAIIGGDKGVSNDTDGLTIVLTPKWGDTAPFTPTWGWEASTVPLSFVPKG